MRLKNFNYLISLLVFFLSSSFLWSEEKIDIWKNNTNNNVETSKSSSKEIQESDNTKASNVIKSSEKIEIQEGSKIVSEERNVFGIFQPADYNFDLNMWSNTKAENFRSSLKRLNKIKLSKSSQEILEIVLLSFSYPPQGMTEEEFVNLKIDWLIKNDRVELIESFLNQNQEFKNKGKAVQFLVDKNIASANIKDGCDKIQFIDAKIKDPYLEKFKIYCLVFNKKNSEAQLLLDLLREQNLSSKFYDNKINYLLGITEKTDNKISEKNLLNFYLSSITNSNFKYEPTPKTKPEIWRYLNSANLIKLEDATNKEKIKELEIAANNNKLDKKTIFEFYKQVPFSLNSLINAKNNYQTFDESDARALIYQKYLLSESYENKIEYLFLLEDLFKKSSLDNIFPKFLSDQIERIGLENVPEKYQETAQSRILSETNFLQGKIKYNDKILHQSKILKYFTEGEDKKKIQKDIDKIFKKVSKNKKYFISAKDLALADTLINDGFSLPESFNYEKLTKKFEIPKNLLKLIDSEQKAFLSLKIVEIIGEDEIYQLDPETIYFLTSLLNKMNLATIRNKVIISAFPERA